MPVNLIKKEEEEEERSLETFLPVLSKEAYLERRIALLEREKALTRENDAISQERRNLGFLMIENDYVFADSSGNQVFSLSLFIRETSLHS